MPGVHGLGADLRLALELKACEQNVVGSNIMAEGIALGARFRSVVGNRYGQANVRGLEAHSMFLWRFDLGACCNCRRLSAEQPGRRAWKVAAIFDEQRAIGYESTIIKCAIDNNNSKKNQKAPS